MNVDLIIFDFDGTLVDLKQNAENVRKGLQKIAKKYGVDVNFKPILEGIEKLNKLAGGKAYKEAVDFINRDDVTLAKKAELIDKANELCHKLSKKGIRLAIFSRTYSNAIKIALNRFNFPNFDVILGRFEGGKTKEDQLKTIIENMKVKPSKTVVVGDHVIDVSAGKKVGCTSIGIKNNRFNEKDLKDAGADFILNEVSEILEVIDK